VWAPKVAKRLRDLAPVIGHNIYKFGFISENIELVGMLEILGRVDLDTVSICLRRCREFFIKVRVIHEG
jgi:hypothetical protein